MEAYPPEGRLLSPSSSLSSEAWPPPRPNAPPLCDSAAFLLPAEAFSLSMIVRLRPTLSASLSVSVESRLSQTQCPCATLLLAGYLRHFKFETLDTRCIECGVALTWQVWLHGWSDRMHIYSALPHGADLQRSVHGATGTKKSKMQASLCILHYFSHEE